MNMIRRSWLVLVVVAAASVGCGGGKRFWAGAPVAVGGIDIRVEEAYTHGEKLTVRTMFFNRSAMPLMVNRDAVVVVLPNGQSVGRYAGTMAAGLNRIPYVIPPGGEHQVFVDFVSGYRWHEFPAVQINWSNAVTMNGAPIALPPTVLSQAR